MAAIVETEGMAEISELLAQLEENAPAVAAKALYKGSSVMAKAIFDEMDRIKTAPFRYAKNGETRLPSPEEKAILKQAGVGIAKFDKNGIEVNTSVGFNQSGYADVTWKHMSNSARTNYKAHSVKGHSSNQSSFLRALGQGGGAQNQKPIGAVANAINSGTSFMKKQPFVRKAEKSGGNKALQAMKDVIETEIDAMIKDNGGK